MPDPGAIHGADGLIEGGGGAMPASEAMYRSVVAALAEGVSLYDAEGRLVASNPMASRILGLEPLQYRERALSDAAWQTVHENGSPWLPEDYPAIRTLRTGEALRREVMGIRRPDGTLRWISINTQPIFGAGRERPVLVVASFADITDYKAALAELRESEDRYRSLVENAPVGIFVDQGGVFAFVNGEMAMMLGAPGPGALVGRRVLDFIHPDFHAAVSERIARALAERRASPVMEQKFIRADGSGLDVEVAKMWCVFRGEPAVQVVARDITERKRLEKSLLQAQKMEAVGRLASGVAHEFGNLLTAITGYTALAKRTLAPGHPAVQALDRVQEAAEQASGVTGLLLTFGRKSGGVKAPVALMEPVERAAGLLRRTLPAAVDLAVRPEGGPVWVMADGNQVQQAVVNLAINARDAMRGLARGRLEVTVGPARGVDGMAAVRVADNGQGMTPEVQGRMFEPFFTTKPSGEGTGLGLAIVRSIVEDHGGRVEVRSRPGEGTEVTLLFPRIAPPAARAGGSALEAKPAAAYGRTVVLAVGSRHARELVAGALIDAGCTVVQAGDGATLMEKRAEAGGGAGLLVINADLPGRPGLECLAELRRGGDLTPAVVICEPDCAGVELDEHSTLLVEPFAIAELASMAARLMGARDGEEEP